jgi:iron complex outermembrane receptor protein
MRITLAVAVACLTIGGIAGAGEASASIRKPTDIPAQGLGPALTSLAKEFDFQVLYRTEVVGTLRTQGASGTLTAAEALQNVLSGTGLTYKYLDEKTVTIVSTSAVGSGQSTPQNAPGSSDGANTSKEVGKKTSQDFRLAQTSQGTPSRTLPVDSSPTSGRGAKSEGIEEIIVTAQKRSERIQDVPVPVTSIDANQLVENNQVRFEDYYTSVPGLSFAPNNQNNYLAIRGIATGGFSNPTVGIVIDDVPFGGSTALGGGQVMPDIDPGDLARVEVLRGPQGTLYGASSMGGLLKFVTVDPSTDALSGRVQAGVSDVHNGAQLGYNVRASINVPINDTLAMSVSGFTRQDPGYIDNPVYHLDGVNETKVSGGRLALLWQPSDVVSVKLGALYQDSRLEGAPQISILPGLGDLQQSFLPGTGWQDTEIQSYSARVTVKLGSVDLASISGYNIDNYYINNDYTFGVGSLVSGVLPGVAVAGTPIDESNSTHKFTQEIRLSSSIGKQFDWVVGGFYTRETYEGLGANIYGVTPAFQPLPAADDLLNLGIYSESYTEYAGFADLTYHFTDRFDVQVGGRESQIKQVNGGAGVTTGLFVPAFYGQPSPVFTPPNPVAKNNAFTYLLTPRFRLSSDLMLYARLASGYRAGGSNGVNPVPPTPPQYGSDKTQNYEIGVKGDFLDHKLSVDASVYYIDWTGIQLVLVNPTNQLNYTVNGSPAKSEGVELSIEARPLAGLTIAAWGAYDDAALTQDLPAGSTAYGVAGNRLPLSPRVSAHLSFKQDFPLWNEVTGFVGGSVDYIGNREGLFISTPDRAYYAPYARADVLAGTRFDSWTVNIFANNITDRRGVLGGGIGMFPPFSYNIIQPRTVGLDVIRKF